MKFRPWRIALPLFLVLGVPYGLLALGTSTPEFKSLAEEKVSQYLKADVKIGKISVGFINRIILSQFEIQPDTAMKSPYRIEVERIVFRYKFSQLFSRNFKTPAAVLLQSPRIVLTENRSTRAFFEGVRIQSAGSGPMSLFELSGGEVRYELPAFDSEIQLKDIRASFVPDQKGKLRASFQADLEGMVKGRIEAKGEMNPSTGERRWDVELKSFSVMAGLLPEENQGDAQITLRNDTLILKEFRIKTAADEFQASGRVDSLNAEPRFHMEVKGGKKQKEFLLSLTADLLTSNFQGVMKMPSLEDVFKGKITRSDGRFLLSDVESGKGIHMEAFLDWKRRQAQVQIENEKQQMELQAKIHDHETDLAYHVNHLDWHGLDVVSAGTLHLKPVRAQGAESFHFATRFHTDYFILEYMPFEDFNGGFKASAAGLQDMTASWGKIFKASGEIIPGDTGLETQLMLRVNGFDLGRIKHFASRPLPRELGGTVKGQLKMSGALARPFVSGKFTVRHGHVGPVEYDSGILQFDGLMPYLKLKDSRILKGRTSLTMTGALDLSLKNMFYGVQIRKFDQGVIWNGMDLSIENVHDKLDLEIDSGISSLPALSMKAGKGTSPEQDSGGENYLEMGPRFRF